MSPSEMNELTLWEYTAMVAVYNERAEEEAEMPPWTPEEYVREREMLRERNDPSIKV